MSIRVRAVDLKGMKLVDADIMRKAGMYLLRLQAQRVMRGEGSNGAPMKPYSPGYAAYRQEKGRPTDRRTLLFSGNMWRARNTKDVTATKVTIGWPANIEAIKALGNEARTPFVKATPEEIRLVTEFIRERIKEKVKAELARLRASKR